MTTDRSAPDPASPAGRRIVWPAERKLLAQCQPFLPDDVHAVAAFPVTTVTRDAGLPPGALGVLVGATISLLATSTHFVEAAGTPSERATATELARFS